MPKDRARSRSESSYSYTPRNRSRSSRASAASYSSYEYSDEDTPRKDKAKGGAKADERMPAATRQPVKPDAEKYQVDVRIESAKDLRNADLDRSDPYCVCEAAGPEPAFDLKEYKRRLELIYEDRDPSKVEKVEKMLDKYPNQEQYLYDTVCWKYNVPPNWDGRSQLPPDLLEEPPEPENSFRTKTVSNKLNPVWNHTGKLVITEGESIIFRVRDQDDGKDEELGKAVLSYEQIAQGYEGELKLTDLRHTGNPTLKVKVTLGRKQGPLLKGNFIKQSYNPANKNFQLSREERESAAIGRIQAKFRGVLERVLLKERRDLREAKRREEQYQELLKEIEETCPGGSCAPGFGFETHLSHYEVDQRFFLERKEKLRINTGAGPTRGLSSLPIPEGQPGPRQQGGVPPAVLKAAKPETPFGTGLSIVPPSVARTAAGRLPPAGAPGAASMSPSASGTAATVRTRKVGAGGPALLGSDARSGQGFSRGYAAGTGPESKPGVGEMPPGLNEEEALKWQMQTLGAQLRSEAVERAREQSRQPSRQQSRAASPSSRRDGGTQARSAGAPPPRDSGTAGTPGGFPGWQAMSFS